MAQKILVTGGTGYIGSHTVVELINAGYDPVIIDNLSNSSPKIIEQIMKITGTRPEFHNFDLCDEKLTRKFLDDHRDISGIIHFIFDPIAYY